MPIVKSISIRNFRCIRQETPVPLSQSTYLVGPNNSGKTTVLAALQCFVDSSAFSPDFLNKSERASKKEGSLRCDIALTFDLSLVTGKERKKRMIDTHGPELTVRKTFTWREISRTTQVGYSIPKGKTVPFDELQEDIQAVIRSLTVSYIHPQEGADLLRKAQEKFKQRLFANWGRHPSVAEKLKTVQADWNQLRSTASSYLSAALTDRLRSIWPDSSTKVGLPERIEDIVAISDIAFRSSPSLPEVTLPHQGTGAQATILYQTHYVLDSDRSLHRGMYFPIWLLEEPESFLHGDIAFQLAALLASDEWLKNIQMVISTHSPIMLSASRRNASLASWVVFDQHAVKFHRPATEVDNDTVSQIGTMMGDANFDIYFSVAKRGPLLFIEDSRPATKDCFVSAGIPVTDHLAGITEVKKHLRVLQTLTPYMHDRITFLVDADQGLRELKTILDAAPEPTLRQDWRCFSIADKLRVIVLPEGNAVEDLFDEWPTVLDEALDDLYDAQLQLRQRVPLDLTRAADELRRNQPATREQVLLSLRKAQDVKNRFWARVQQNNCVPAANRIAGLTWLLAH
jgi:hypothetical protein